MELKLAEIIDLNGILKRLIDTKEFDLSPLFKFKLLGIMKLLETHVINFEMIKNDKIREYGKEKDDNTIIIDINDKESVEKYKKDIDPLLNSKIKVDIQKLKAVDVFNENLSSDYLVALYPIIEA